MLNMIEQASYLAHGYCLLWQPWLVALYGGADLLIFLAYSAIPVALFRFIRLRPDMGYTRLVALFGAFIMLCGLTHLVSFISLWYPIYVVHAGVKLATAAVSLVTAAILFPLVPKLAAIPSPTQLQEANRKLKEEIAAHERTLAQLREAQHTLEMKVSARTAELESANERLSVVTHEAVHRAKNILTVVQSLARQTARTAPDKASFLERFSGRLAALSNATSAVIHSGHAGAGEMRSIILSQLDPYIKGYPGRLAVDGAPYEVRADAAQQIALAIHELATNAVKYGALADPRGQVDLSWSVGESGSDLALDIEWRETTSGGGESDTLRQPSTGFGSFLLTNAVPAQLGAEVSHELSETGLLYKLSVPLANLAPRADLESLQRTEAHFPIDTQTA